MMSYKISSQGSLLTVAMITLVLGFSLEDVQHRSQRLDGSGFSTDRVKNFLQCTDLCIRRSRCKSVNYNTITRECTSNYHDLLTSQAPLTPDVTGVVFAEKRSMSQNGGVCDNSPCEETQVCIQMGSQRKCLTEDVVHCGVQVVQNGTFQHGSTIVGSSASIKCDDYFRFFGSSPSMKCEVTGLWTGLSGTCQQVEWRNENTNLSAAVPAPLVVGWEMVLNGTPKENNEFFSVNLMDSDDILVCLSAKFNWNNVTRFDYLNKFGSNWTVLRTTDLPFKELKPFHLRMQLQATLFQIILDEEILHDFVLRKPAKSIDHVLIKGDIIIKQLKFIYK